MTNSIDQLVILLSADWFLPKWHLLGLHSTPQAIAAFQRRCRALTLEFSDGEVDYWLVSFEEERIAQTRDNFYAAAAGFLMTSRVSRAMILPLGPA